MTELKVYNQKGESSGKVALPENIFAVQWNADLVHQVVTGMLSNKRAGTADTKGRGEVRGGGKKPWRQKGTGRARHGSTRSPIWVGGGVTHGPLAEKNYKKKISKKMRALALFCVLSKKVKKNEIIFVENLEQKEIKTKNALEVMANLAKATKARVLAKAQKPKALVVLVDRSPKTEKSFRNLPQLDLVFLKNLNPVDVLNHQYLILENPEVAIKFLETRASK